MRTRRVEKILAVVAATMLLSMGAAWAAPQTKEQQKCINKLNKDGIKVQATQGKENTECVKRKNNDELGNSLTGTGAEDCINADGKGKVGKKQGKTSADDAKFCSAPNTPGFAYLTAGTVNAVTVQAEKDLLHDIFGGPPVDSGLYSKNPHVNEAVCQRNVIKRVEKLIQTMGREFVKCKKNALKTKKEPFSANGAASSSDLHVCVEDPGTINSVAADTKGKIAKREQNLLDTITKQCESTGVSATSFPGECSGDTGATLQQCLIDITECRFCQMINLMDGLSVDCDAFSGITCP